MKKLFSTLIFICLTILMVNAQTVKTEKILALGSCDMCKTRIEKTIKAIDGVSSAVWDLNTKMVEVKYNSEKTNVSAISAEIAKVGHDTKLYKATDAVYASLPACCKYERMKTDNATNSSGCGSTKPCNHSCGG
jgi:copper chaperone CopZ